MVGTFRATLVLGAMLISACAPMTAPSTTENDLKTAKSAQPQLAEYRRLEIELHHRHIISEERMHEACAPWKDSCVWVAPANARPALRGEAPFQAQITPPDNYVTEELGEVPFDDWQERHFCGGSLIAPGWVITAAHCVDAGMVEDGFQVRLGMSNLQRFDGRTFPIERVICFSEEDCARGASGVVYEHDIALLKFTFDPSDFKPAPPMEAFEDVGIYATDLSPDQSYLMTWSEDDTVRVWDIDNGQELTREAFKPYPWIGPRSGDAINEPPLRTMIGRSNMRDPELDLYGAYAVEDLEAHNIQGFPDWYHSESLTSHSYRFFDQGRRLLVKRDQWGVEGASNLSWIWSGTSTDEGIVFGAPRSFGYSDAMALSPDEQVLVTVANPEIETPSNRKNSILAWNPATMDFLWEYVVHNKTQNSSAWLFSGGALKQLGFAEPGVVFGYDDEVFVLDEASGAVLASYQHPRSEPWLNAKRRQVFTENDPYFPIESDGTWVQNNVQDAQLVWTTRGDELVTLTKRFAESDVWVWDTARREVRLRLKHEDPLWSEYVEGAQPIGNGDRLFTWTNYGTLRVWDMTSGELISKMRQELPLLKGVFVNGDRSVIIQDKAGATVWDLNSGKQISRVDHLNEVLTLTVAENETQLLTTSYDGTARVWSAQAGREVRRIYHDGTVNGASFIAEGQKILTWSDDGTSRITNLETGDAEMIFDVAKAPPGSPLTPAVSDRPKEPIAVSYLPIPPEDHELKVGEDVVIYGWGKTEAVVGEDPYATLLSVSLSVMDNADCLMMEGMGPTSKGERRVHENVFCAFDEIQKTCRGDSGGPVIQNGDLIGIVSWGKKQCTGDGMPGVYTRVHNYRDWIKQHIMIELPQPIVIANDMEDLND